MTGCGSLPLKPFTRFSRSPIMLARMTCPVCDKALTASCDHHDHLRDLAGDYLARILPTGSRQLAGPLEDALQRSGRLDPHLRFAEAIGICNDCNTLENAWKIKSNKNRHSRGFLPTYFTLMPHEIKAARSRRAVTNKEPVVREALKSIWLNQRDGHLSRRVMVMREIRAFLRHRGVL